MVVTGVEVNNQLLPMFERINSTTCYKAFMVYCIENHSDSIIISDTLQKRFRLAQHDPDFKRAIDYKRICGHNGLYYSTYQGTRAKIRIMKLIAEELGVLLILRNDQEED